MRCSLKTPHPQSKNKIEQNQSLLLNTFLRMSPFHCLLFVIGCLSCTTAWPRTQVAKDDLELLAGLGGLWPVLSLCTAGCKQLAMPLEIDLTCAFLYSEAVTEPSAPFLHHPTDGMGPSIHRAPCPFPEEPSIACLPTTPGLVTAFILTNSHLHTWYSTLPAFRDGSVVQSSFSPGGPRLSPHHPQRLSHL